MDLSIKTQIPPAKCKEKLEKSRIAKKNKDGMMEILDFLADFFVS